MLSSPRSTENIRSFWEKIRASTPSAIWPLTKKVGVESTPNLSLARWRTATLARAGRGRNLAEARNWHFLFAWVFVINGLIYLVWALVSGRFKRRLLPTNPKRFPVSPERAAGGCMPASASKRMRAGSSSGIASCAGMSQRRTRILAGLALRCSRTAAIVPDGPAKAGHGVLSDSVLSCKGGGCDEENGGRGNECVFHIEEFTEAREGALLRLP